MTDAVTREDQNNIALFSKLHAQRKQLDNDIADLEAQINAYDDASNELILLEQDYVHVQLGECYLRLEPDEATEKIEEDLNVLRDDLDKVKTKRDELLSECEDLKKVLYGKFGDRIHLEDE